MIERIPSIKVFLIGLCGPPSSVIGIRLWDEMHGKLYVLPGFGI